MIILDGVYAFDSEGHPRFHAVNQPDLPGLDRLFQTIIGRILKTLESAGLLIQKPGTQPDLNLQPEGADNQLSAAAVRYIARLAALLPRPALTSPATKACSHPTSSTESVSCQTTRKPKQLQPAE